MLKNRFSLYLVSSLLVLALSGCTQKSADSENEIRIGEYGSMTGGEATFGTSTHNGIKMVVDKVNAEGGINGKKLRLISLDNQGKPEETVTVVTRLVTQDKVHVLLGEVASSRSLAAAPIAQRNQIPMISPSSTNPKVTEVGNFIFRVCFIDPFQGTVVARYAAEDLKAKTAALLVDQKSDYAVGLADFFKKAFIEKGGQIVEEQKYQSGDVDFKAQLTSIRAKNPDVIMVPGYYTEVGLLIKQAKALGVKSVFVGGDGWDSPKLIEIGGDAMNGNFFANHYSAEDKDPRVQQFIKDYQSLFNEVPDGLAAMGYDAALVLVDALKRTKSLSGPDLRDAIAATKNFPGVTGQITLDAQRNASKAAVMIKIEDKQLRFAKRIDP